MPSRCVTYDHIGGRFVAVGYITFYARPVWAYPFHPLVTRGNPHVVRNFLHPYLYRHAYAFNHLFAFRTCRLSCDLFRVRRSCTLLACRPFCKYPCRIGSIGHQAKCQQPLAGVGEQAKTLQSGIWRIGKMQ